MHIQKKRIPYKTVCIKNIIEHMHIQKKRIPYKTLRIKKGVWKRKKDKDITLHIKKGTWRRKKKKFRCTNTMGVFGYLWCPLLMITLYHQIKTPISFWCRRGLNPRSLIQALDILPVDLPRTHKYISSYSKAFLNSFYTINKKILLFRFQFLAYQNILIQILK